MSTSQSQTIVDRVFKYTPNGPVAIAAVVVFILAGSLPMFRLVRQKAWWSLCLPLGAFHEAIGFVFRYMLIGHPNSFLIFSPQQFYVICSPAAFLAFNYIVYRRMISAVGAEHAIINPLRIAPIFVGSDIVTFLLQVCGGSVLANPNLVNVGDKLSLVGAILQTISYCCFCVLLIKSHMSIKNALQLPTTAPPMKLISVLYFSSAFILIRCFFRIAEFAQGTSGYLFTHEGFFYTLDVLPLLPVIAVYAIYWPNTYINAINQDGGVELGYKA